MTPLSFTQALELFYVHNSVTEFNNISEQKGIWLKTLDLLEHHLNDLREDNVDFYSVIIESLGNLKLILDNYLEQNGSHAQGLHHFCLLELFKLYKLCYNLVIDIAVRKIFQTEGGLLTADCVFSDYKELYLRAFPTNLPTINIAPPFFYFFERPKFFDWYL